MNDDSPGKEGPASALERAGLLAAMEAASIDAIITIDGKGLVQSFNPAAERLFGYARSEVLGRNVKILMPAHFRAEHDRYLSRYLETGEKHIIGIGRVVAGKKKDGSTFPIELSVAESRVNGTPVFVGFIRDLTQIQTERSRVEELQHELFHVNRLAEMGQVVSSLAHEVNQPLTAITNYVQVAQQMLDGKGRSSDVSMGDILQKLEAQAKRAADIVKRLRGFVRRREAERQPENLATLIEEALALGIIGQAAGQIHVQLALQPELPPVDVDRVQIQQVIVNLVRNAIDAMDGQERRELLISSAIDGAGYVRISVSDVGPGISPEVADRLFGAFVTTKEDGMGVGLSICKVIVESHGGTIWFTPADGGGTTFHFTVPIERSTAAADE
jgi:two-component system sensor kinase FixL